MKRTSTILAICATALTLAACSSQKSTDLFNGTNLTGWNSWLVDQTLDPATEFTVVDSSIRMSGKFGYVYTDKSYSDYILEFDWRWIDTATNSGVFVHMQPGNKEWPMSYEYQLCAGKAGDIVNSGGSSSAEYIANPESVVIEKQNPSNEKAVGEWNHGEIICDGNTVTIYTNGVLQNKLTETSLSSGQIGLQSEGEGVEFRNVKLTPIK